LLWAASCRRAPSSEPRKMDQTATGSNWPRDIALLTREHDFRPLDRLTFMHQFSEVAVC
jgi:hypothetical protein